MNVSYWQQGCNDAKSGRPYNESMRLANGYDNGYYYGQHGKGKFSWTSVMTMDDADELHWFTPESPRPYMEVIENIEHVMDELHSFANSYPKLLDKAKLDEYITNLLEVRDALHNFRKAELA